MRSLAQISKHAAQIIFILLMPISNSFGQQTPKRGMAMRAEAASDQQASKRGVATSAATGSGQQAPKRGAAINAAAGSIQPPAAGVSYLKAFVIDVRLSALRRQPGLQSTVARRLRVAHAVFIIGTSKPKPGQPTFCRVAVTRRTRGWILESALAVQGRRNDDQRIMKLIEGTDGVDKITLCRILTEHFTRSRLVPRAMLLLGEEAERAAETLTQRARRRLAEVRGAVASRRDYYLSDASLDRYSKLGVVFDFNESTEEFVYNGREYREITRRFPVCDEALLASQRLELARRKMTRQH